MIIMRIIIMILLVVRRPPWTTGCREPGRGPCARAPCCCWRTRSPCRHTAPGRTRLRHDLPHNVHMYISIYIYIERERDLYVCIHTYFIGRGGAQRAAAAARHGEVFHGYLLHINVTCHNIRQKYIMFKDTWEYLYQWHIIHSSIRNNLYIYIYICTPSCEHDEAVCTIPCRGSHVRTACGHACSRL